MTALQKDMSNPEAMDSCVLIVSGFVLENDFTSNTGDLVLLM